MSLFLPDYKLVLSVGAVAVYLIYEAKKATAAVVEFVPDAAAVVVEEVSDPDNPINSAFAYMTGTDTSGEESFGALLYDYLHDVGD